MHKQIPISGEENYSLFEMNPTYNISFQVSKNDQFDFRDHRKNKYDLIYETKKVHGFKTSLVALEKLLKPNEDDSFVLYLPKNQTFYFTVAENHSLNSYLDLPCSLVSYDLLSYKVTFENGTKLPSWLTINFTYNELEIKAPLVDQTTQYMFTINTTYLSGQLSQNFYITIQDINQNTTQRSINETSPVPEIDVVDVDEDIQRGVIKIFVSLIKLAFTTNHTNVSQWNTTIDSTSQ